MQNSYAKSVIYNTFYLLPSVKVVAQLGEDQFERTAAVTVALYFPEKEGKQLSIMRFN